MKVMFDLSLLTERKINIKGAKIDANVNTTMKKMMKNFLVWSFIG